MVQAFQNVICSLRCDCFDWNPHLKHLLTLPISLKEESSLVDLSPQRPQKSTNIRRSQRLLLVVRISVSGKNLNGSSFTEEAFTQVVNVHGALVLTKHPLALGDRLLFKNLKTGEEASCRVVDLGDRVDHKDAMGVEFDQPASHFWRVPFLRTTGSLPLNQSTLWFDTRSSPHL